LPNVPESFARTLFWPLSLADALSRSNLLTSMEAICPLHVRTIGIDAQTTTFDLYHWEDSSIKPPKALNIKTASMIPRQWGRATRFNSATQSQLARRLSPLTVGGSIFRPRTEHLRRAQISAASRAFSQTRQVHEKLRHSRAQDTLQNVRTNHQQILHPSNTVLQSRFPTKTVIALVLVGGLAYYLIDIVEPSWTDDVYAAFSSGDDASTLTTPLHFYRNRTELQHTLDYHIPDPSAPLKDPNVAKFFSDQFEKLCFGWMMSEDDARKGVEGMEDVQMPITHGCRFRSNEPCEDFFALGTSPGPGEKMWNYWTVLDGHAGRHTAFYLQWSLIPMVSSALCALPRSASSPEIENTIKNAFVAVDRSIMDRAKTAANWYPAANAAAIAALTPAFSGSCALLAAFDASTSTLRVACTGDSRAVLGRWDPATSSYKAIPLSEDQTGFNAAEVARLTQEHPDEPSIIDPKSGRLLGIAVTRAFGDHRWKWDNELVKACQHKFWGTAPRPGSKTPPYMTAEPEVTETQIVRQEPDDYSSPPSSVSDAGKSDFLILASDGLWDRISSDHAVECVQRYLEARSRGKGSVLSDPHLQANPPNFSSVSSSLAPKTIYSPMSVQTSGGGALEPGVTCDPEQSQDVDWKATPEYFAIEDENAAVCLARNAMGGTRRALFLGILAGPEPLSRNAVDDTTIMVVFFDKLGSEKKKQKSGGGAQAVAAGQESGDKKKRWWWPL
jgi:pyruvate dehydrogenase phosphatase